MEMILLNCTVYDYENFIDKAYLVIESGKISQVGRMEDLRDSLKDKHDVIDMKNRFVMPGFVNCHTHVYSTFARGIPLKVAPEDFRDILEKMWWKLDSALDLEAVYYSGLVAGIECIKNGVTTLFDHHAGTAISGSLETLRKSLCDVLGLRAVLCFETSDRFDVSACLDENLSFMSRRNAKSLGLFGLHASFTLSENTLSRVSEVLEDRPIHIHVAEAPVDEKASVEKYGMRILERLKKHNLLNENSILAHCVHIDELEADIISESGAFVAVNPTSNMNNGVGLPNTKLLRRHSVSFVVGTDGLGFNLTRDLLNLFFTQRLLLGQGSFDLEDLRRAILHSYSLASTLFEKNIGRIMPGYIADLITFDYATPTPLSEENIFAHIFFGVWDRVELKDVMVGGEFLMRDGNLRVDQDEIFSRSRRVCQKVWRRMGL